MNKRPQFYSERHKEKIDLIVKMNYFASVTMISFALVFYFFLDIKKVIPHILITYGILNVANSLLFAKHKNLHASYLISTTLGIIGAILVSLYSGGIRSPFIFILVLIVFSGYVSTRNYGKFHLYLILVVILAIYISPYIGIDFPVMVPKDSRSEFSLLVILFCLYISGDIFGRMLLGNYNKLYHSKREIEKKNHEKELLLKEIHHRVKNNLQTISSLLNMQARATDNQEIKSILHSNHNRVFSMAMVHEMLYAHEDLSKIDYQNYVEQLCNFQIGSFKKSDEDIQYNINIKSIKLNIETAVPLSLLISELITNSLKHAFPNTDKGIIKISIEKTDPVYFLLTYSDTGIGMDTATIQSESQTMGVKLIEKLARQLRGTLKLADSKNGTTFLVKFKEI
ncbi:sensor histidine kinase [Galbibacter sp.]|uniref:sensor histidine kinase n=1 Tax=Galbibacter sp. TaxID=2918471 RepID=UPI003A904228